MSGRDPIAAKAYRAAYNAANAERIREARRVHYAKNREAVLARNAEWARRNRSAISDAGKRRASRDPEKATAECRRRHAKRRIEIYGVSEADYAARLAAQGGLCAICARPETRRHGRTGTLYQFDIDHDHQTGKVRALLCGACNRALGLFRDDPALLRAAAAYLESHRVQADSA